MRLRFRTGASTLALLAASVSAQLTAQGTDPVSGKWSGFFFRPTDGTRTAITMDLALDAAGAGAADQRNPNDAKDVMRGGFAEVSGWVTKAAEMVPADKYNYRPTQTVRTFGQLIGHIADSHNWYCAIAGGKNTEWSDAIEKGTSDKAGLDQKLKQSIDACNALYNGTGRTKELMANIAHTSLHYGNIITYMRMMGLVPPSS